MRLLLYLIIILAAAGCSTAGSCEGELHHARAEMQSDPSAALDRLSAIDVSALNDSSEVAQWAMLYTEALIANRLAAPSDTIINIAIDYYHSRHDATSLQKADALKKRLELTTRPDELLRARYLQKVREYALFRERQQKQLWIAWSVAALALAGGIIVWLCYRLRLRRVQTAALLAEAASLRETASGTDALRSAVNTLFSTRFDLIDRLCNTYYESQGTKAERNAIAAEVKAEIDALRHDSDTFARLETLVNESRDNALERLRETFPKITDAEYTLAVYLACGFSPRAMSLLLEDRIENVYKRKSRLKAKLTPFPDLQAVLIS